MKIDKAEFVKKYGEELKSCGLNVNKIIDAELLMAESKINKNIPFSYLNNRWNKILYLTYKEIVANGADPKDYYLYPAKIKDANENEIYEMRFKLNITTNPVY